MRTDQTRESKGIFEIERGHHGTRPVARQERPALAEDEQGEAASWDEGGMTAKS